MTTRIPAEVSPPGDFIQEELEERGWTQGDLAEIIGRSRRLVTELVNAKRGVTPETARALADAFGTSAEFWLNLETAYRLSRVGTPDDAIARKARIYSIGPIKDMTRRGWIEPTDNVDVLETQIVQFFGLNTIDEEPVIPAHVASKSTEYDYVTKSYVAWMQRARTLASTLHASPFSVDGLEAMISRLKADLRSVEQIESVPQILADGGIRFLVVEHLPNTRIDGACFWLDDDSPVIALSLRLDRVDYFWYSLMHLIGHVRNRDGLKINDAWLDSDLFASHGNQDNYILESEFEADRFATNVLVPQNAFQDFIDNVGPNYSKKRVMAFAEQFSLHPAIVVGHLQRRGEINISQFRQTFERVRDPVASVSLTDGWGYIAPTRWN